MAERRLVSVLFADLVGFTPFAEERDAEDVRDTLTRYFDIASDIIGRYGGTVEKFIGDDAIAGYREAMADHRSIHAGWALASDALDMVRLVGGNHPAVRDAADEARGIFERVGAQAYLDLLAAAVAGTGIDARPAASGDVFAPRGAQPTTTN